MVLTDNGAVKAIGRIFATKKELRDERTTVDVIFHVFRKENNVHGL